ncbi:MAG: Exodeoxyribonuclease, partial [Deltaproteobacteria bacterium]|nr:Exodeoxyribonuclease [Deltaproteobacteria bacterium]
GADGSAHEGTYLEDHPGHFHWDQGVRRLALGAFMVGERAQRGAAKIANTAVAPEELRPDQQASAATYALLVRSLCADAAWLAIHEAPLARWAEILAALVDQYLSPRDAEATRDLERVRSMLAGLAHLDVDDRPMGFREAREHAARQLASARASRGEPLASGVMIAPLAAMRAIPFRVVFVAGLDEGAFPAGDHPSPLDLRTSPGIKQRAGDVSPRDRDRAAFLDVLLCARDALFLSYVAIEPKSGQPLGPSSVVLELADALTPYLGVGSSREALAAITTRHPLHRFGGTAPAILPAVARERWACAVRDDVHAHLRAAGHPIPDEDGQLALLADPSQAALRVALGVEDAPARPPASPVSRPLTIANLRGFLEHPIQAWAQAVLGLDELPDDQAAEHSEEPFHLGRPDRAVLLREVFATHLREPARAIEACYDAAIADIQLRGQFPVGVFAEAARALDLAVLETWLAGVGSVARMAPISGLAGAVRFGFGRAFSPGATLHPALEIELASGSRIRLMGQTELLVPDGDRRFVSVIPMLRELSKKTPYHLRGAFDHVVLAAAGLANDGHIHTLIDHHGHVCEIEHEPWSRRDASAFLARLAGELLELAHGYLLPFETLVKGLSGGKPEVRSHGDPTGGLGYGPIERRDGLSLPPEIAEIADRRLRPLVERMRGDHGFEPGAGRSSSPKIAPPGPAMPPPTTPGPASRGSRPVLSIVKGGLA